jgi:hypothetical protein
MMTEISYSGYRFPPSLAVGAEAPSLLAGLIVDAGGNRMTPAHATERAKRYRYYWRRLITCKHRKGCASRREISRGWCSTGLGRFSPPGLRSLTRSHRSILRLARLMRPYAMHSRFQSDGVPPLSILNNIKDDLQRSSEKRAIDEWRSIRHELDEQIEKAKDLAWDACFRTATRTGLFVAYGGASDSGEPPSRLVARAKHVEVGEHFTATHRQSPNRLARPLRGTHEQKTRRARHSHRGAL